MRTFTRQDIYELIESIGETILAEGDNYIETTNSFCGEALSFEFDKNGVLTRIGS